MICPRLSVDIDLTYTSADDRTTALEAINKALQGLKSDIERLVVNSIVTPKKFEEFYVSLLVRAGGTVVKIEPNLVLRGTIYQPQIMFVTQHVHDEFAVAVKAKVLAMEDIYGGKICAALDRQHPRDLFDVKLLLDNEGITESIRKSFIVHLISHDRPMAELLDPNFQDIKEVFRKEFDGMTFIRVSIGELEDTRAKLLKTIRESLNDKERQFILSIKKCDPRWDLLELAGIDILPAVNWKLYNISKMNKKKHKVALHKLEKCLSP